MDNILLDKLDKLLKEIDNNKEIKRYLSLKDKLLNDEELLDKINKIKTSNYNSEYISIKNDIINDDNYKEYIKVEREIYYLVNNINKEFKELSKL